MERNGFTLIELLAVIAILSILALITIPIISTSISSSKASAYERQKEMIVKSAEEFISENAIGYNSEAICVEKLISEGYLKDGEIINPNDSNENMREGCVKTTVSGKNYIYQYKKNEECELITNKYC